MRTPHARPLERRPTNYREHSLRTTVWHLVVLASIAFAVPALSLGRPLLALELDENNALLITAIAAAYLCGIVVIKGIRRFLQSPPILTSVAVATALVAAVAVSLIVVDPQYSRRILLPGLLGIVAGLAAPTFLGTWLWGASAAGVALLLSAAVSGSGGGPDHIAQAELEVLQAGGYVLTVRRFTGPETPDAGIEVRGGAITPDPAGDGFLLVTARGLLFRARSNASGTLRVQDMGISVPINVSDFAESMADSVSTGSFRVADIAATADEARARIWVSHHYWHRDRQCFTVRVSSTTLPVAGMAGVVSWRGGVWRTLFESRPCLPVFASRGTAFAGDQIGGNLELMDSGELLLTIGDHQFDGWYHSPNYIDDLKADYGKTLIIDTETGASRIFTVGHRNPQGLALDAEGRIWATEHGPQGGDELNLLEDGRHYGYPHHTHGTEYGGIDWPPGREGREPEDAVRPVFAWVPSIGISEVISLDEEPFPRWHGDLLVASLRSQRLWRVRLDGERVVYTEPLLLSVRIRDMAIRPGQLLLWTDGGALIEVTPADDLSSGAAVFTLACGGCHDDTQNRIGPHLRRIIGREVGSVSDYDYSPALKGRGGTWTEDRLHAFLEAPYAFAPGTKMAFEGLADQEARSAVIEYLRSVY